MARIGTARRRLRLIRRGGRPGWAVDLGVTLLALVVGASLGAALLAAAGIDPLAAYLAIMHGAFLDGAAALADTATEATPLILTGLGCAVAFRAGLWNVGAEGQLLVGAWATAGVASFWWGGGRSPVLTLLLMAAAAILAGALWAMLAGALKAWLGASEILTSLMLCYVAVQWNNYWIYSPWSDRGFQMTPMFPREAWLPTFADLWPAGSLAGSQAHVGLLVALGAAALLWLIVSRTRFGFELTLMGASVETAHYAGIPVARRTLLVMGLSGALAGLAGMVELAGVVHRLQEHFSPGYGFSGILIAYLARLHPVAVVVAAVLLGGLLVGAKAIQPGGIAMMLEGVLLLSLIGFELVRRWRIVWVEATASAAVASQESNA